jgi:hypothetical protein
VSDVNAEENEMKRANGMPLLYLAALLVVLAAQAMAQPVIASVFPTTATRSGRILISGSGFAASQGSGLVNIGSRSALISRWSDTLIATYVPEASKIGVANVQVTNSSGASNLVPVTVTARPKTRRLKWRFQADGLYIFHRPGVGSDGTVYANDTSGNLYAISSTGGLKWIFKAGFSGGYGPVAVSADGTIYVASLGTIYAVNPNGTLKWQFTESPGGQGVIGGPGIGPDGNIYVVTDLGGLGAFALSPQGQLLWNVPGFSEYGQVGQELGFGSGSFHFDYNMVGTGQQATLFGYTLAGTKIFGVSGGDDIPSAVAPDGNIYLGLTSYNPDGSLKNYWVLGSGISDVGSDGVAYGYVGLMQSIYALNPDSSTKWTFKDPNYLYSPIVSPTNDQLVIGGAILGQNGFVESVSTQGKKLWQFNLPVENGSAIYAASRPKFPPDGLTVYVGTFGASEGGSPYCYLYALKTH